MFETTSRDRHLRQQRSQQALGVLLEHGYEQGLPALTWTVAVTGALVGDVDTLNGTQAEKRAAFDAWVDYLGGNRWQEYTNVAGRTHLHAQFTWAGDERVRGAIRADIWPDDETPTS